ncbi:DUF6542 domain-containing protein [Streptomyces sp. G45]|uniref:DUF6542 domain-containing protein n=1 Tax=Streptomyces sp. G45 TaxID=3406627 RepID=UPI003C27C107
MEQHRTRPPSARPRRTPPLPEQGSPAESATVYRAASRPRPAPTPLGRALRRTPLYRALSRMPLYRKLRRMPNPRLTGLGGGLFAVAVMFLLACLLRLLFGGSPVAYGVLFLPVSALTALWVRPADLVTAPVCVPIAFAAGILPIAEGAGGFGGSWWGCSRRWRCMPGGCTGDAGRRVDRDRAEASADGAAASSRGGGAAGGGGLAGGAGPRGGAPGPPLHRNQGLPPLAPRPCCRFAARPQTPDGL